MSRAAAAADANIRGSLGKTSTSTHGLSWPGLSYDTRY